MGACCHAERDKPSREKQPPPPCQRPPPTENPETTFSDCKAAKQTHRNSLKPQAETSGKRRESKSQGMKSEAATEVEICSGLSVKPMIEPITKKYLIGSKLYSDRFSTVYFAEHIKTHQKRIIKKMRKASSRSVKDSGLSPEEEFKAEVRVLSQIDHPNVIKLFEMFEDQEYFYLVSEALTGGTVLDHLFASKSTSESSIAQIMAQVFSGIAHCHARNIIHRNLQIENIILESVPKETNIRVKLTGFGAACLRSDQEKLSKRVGSSLYVSPEALKTSYTQKSDVWSCGVILYLLLAGSPPFYGESNGEIFWKIKNEAPEFPTALWSCLSPEATNLVRSMLIRNPAFRPSASECLNHPWIRKHTSSIELTSMPVTSALAKLRTFHSKLYLKQTVLSLISAHLTSSQEYDQLIAAFKAMDKNKDGVLSKEELLEAYSKTMKADQAATVVEGVMQSVDLDGSGFVDYSEFVLAATNHQTMLTPASLRLVYQLFSPNPSGQISVSEFKSTLRTKDPTASDEAWEKLMRLVGVEGEEMDFKAFSRLMIAAVGR